MTLETNIFFKGVIIHVKAVFFALFEVFFGEL